VQKEIKRNTKYGVTTRAKEEENGALAGKGNKSRERWPKES